MLYKLVHIKYKLTRRADGFHSTQLLAKRRSEFQRSKKRASGNRDLSGINWHARAAAKANVPPRSETQLLSGRQAAEGEINKLPSPL